MQGHLKATRLRCEDGTSPVEARVKLGTRYSFIETLENGRCWRLRKLWLRDKDGVEFNIESAFFSVFQNQVMSLSEIDFLESRINSLRAGGSL